MFCYKLGWMGPYHQLEDSILKTTLKVLKIKANVGVPQLVFLQAVQVHSGSVLDLRQRPMGVMGSSPT